MPTFIKTGYWDKLSKAPKGYLNLDLISANAASKLTKAELDIHITNGTLIPGAMYEISGVDPQLYGGTTVFLQAATNNQLSLQGYGIFYNPKYDQSVDGYGIWDNYMDVAMTNIVGTFTPENEVIANTGGIGIYYTNNIIKYTSGNWSPSSVTSIEAVGDSGITADVLVSVLPSYPIGTRVIWGGKHWDNLTGEIGTAINKYTLDETNWQVVPFNSTDYNIAVDIIKYNYDNDEIFSREDKSGNVVEGYFLNND